MYKGKRVIKKIKAVPRNCGFCKGDTTPDYKDLPVLQKYLTERGKLLSRTKTGICSLHQRRIAKAVKKARILALLPFVVRA